MYTLEMKSSGPSKKNNAPLTYYEKSTYSEKIIVNNEWMMDPSTGLFYRSPHHKTIWFVCVHNSEFIIHSSLFFIKGKNSKNYFAIWLSRKVEEFDIIILKMF